MNATSSLIGGHAGVNADAPPIRQRPPRRSPLPLQLHQPVLSSRQPTIGSFAWDHDFLYRCYNVEKPLQSSRPSSWPVRLYRHPPKHLLFSSGVEVVRTGRGVSAQSWSLVPGSQQSHCGNTLSLHWAELKKRHCHPDSTRHGLQLHTFRHAARQVNTLRMNSWLTTFVVPLRS